MYASSSQLYKWTFSSEEDLLQMHTYANRKHIEKCGEAIENRESFFLTVDEEQVLLRHYEKVLYDFCCDLKPKLPQFVMSTAFHYFKRFYLTTSVMDHHPKDIVVTCVYLAAKIEEFYLPLSQVIANVSGNQDKAREIVLDKELVVMEQINFNLIVHHPFRPIEGFLIDMKTNGSFYLPERLRPDIKEFLKRLLLTDAYLLYSPTQIALAAFSYAAKSIGETIQCYMNVLLKECSEEEKKCLDDKIQKILEIKTPNPLPPKEVIQELKLRLERCRNQVHNFGTQEYIANNEAKCLSLDEEELNIAKFFY